MNNLNVKYLVTSLFLFILLGIGSCKQAGDKPLSTEETAEREGSIRLSLNENSFPIDQAVKDAIIGEVSNINRYAEKEGVDFVQFIAAHEGVDPEQIIVGEILDLLGVYLALKEGKDSEFIYSVPGYPVFANAAAGVGAKIIEVPLDENLGNDLDAIEKEVNEKTAAIFLINPHNPSGVIIDSQKFNDFISRVSKKALIIVDEAYLEYAGDVKELSAIKNLKAGDNVLIFRTLAKAYGLAGLTMGYSIAPKELVQYLKSKGLGNSHALNRLSIVASKASLSNQDKIQKEYRIIEEERNKWNLLLDSLGLKHSVSKANFIFFDVKRASSEVKVLFQENKIAIGPTYSSYPTWIRIAIGTPEENAKVQDILRTIIKTDKASN